MYRILGNCRGGDGYSDISFREPELWDTMAIPGDASRVAGSALSSSAILFGNETDGPAVLLLALAPDARPPDAPSHAHASDNWRISLLGNLRVGPDSYDAGESRFQEGWKPYASDNYANGPDGGWTALLFADRRGMRVRHVKRHDGPTITPMDRLLADWMGVGGDLVAEDPDCGVPDASAMATTLDDHRRGARINVSFSRTEQWSSVDGVDVMAGALGDRSRGPVVIQARVPAGATLFGGVAIDCETVRLVSAGSFVLDGREYRAGDMRVQAAGAPFGTAVAGAEGVDEVIMLADRRCIDPAAAGDGVWRDLLTLICADLSARLAVRVGA